MIIEYKNYKIEAENNRFNVYKSVTRNKIDIKTKKEIPNEIITSDDALGFGFTLTNAIRTIITHELECRNETYSLKEYINEFKKLLNEINDIIK